MKTLFLIRHAKTEQQTDYSKTDFERKLLPRGHKDSALIAEQLKERRYFPDLFITSEAKRAKQTAEIFAEILNHPTESIIKKQFIYDGYTTSEMMDFLGNFDNQYDSIIVFGHNPDIASFAQNLIPNDLFHFPTCCIIGISFDVENWKDIQVRTGKVELYIYPKMLK
jgi:phosphohistidine phosphatase